MKGRKYPRATLCVFVISVLVLLILMVSIARNLFGLGGAPASSFPSASGVLKVVGVFFLMFIAGYSSPFNTRVLKEKKKKEDMETLADANGLLHISGLSVPNQTKCHVYLNRSSLVIECDHARFAIPEKHISEISLLDLSQVNKQYIDNASGAIAGCLMFGAIGALLMGGTKEITEVNERYFLNVTYFS